MCVILHLAKKQTVSQEILRNCYDRNADGWGIMWNEKGTLWHVKELSSFDKFMKALKEVPRHAERGIHFRIRTHGETNSDNCHPFVVTEGVAMMHNGTINSAPLIDSRMSDTHNFVKYEVAPIVENWDGDFIFDETFKSLMESVSGYSRLLFMDAEGNALRCGNTGWTKHEGIWFSNASSHLPIQKPYVYSGFGNENRTGYTSGYPRITSVAGTTTPASTSCDVVGDCSKAKDVTPRHVGQSAAPFRTAQSNVQDRSKSSDSLYDASGKLRAQFANSTGGTSAASKNGSALETDPKTLPQASDLYSGNKSAEEGEAYIAMREEEQRTAMEQDRLAIEEALAQDPVDGGDFLGDEVANYNPASIPEEEEDEDEEEKELLYLDTNDLGCMDIPEILQHMEFYPKSMAYTIKGLLIACQKTGKGEIDVTQLGVDAAIEEEQAAS